MAKRQIIWTHRVNEERKEILSYWIQQNKSKVFSSKLNKLIIESLKLTAEFPETGRKTTLDNVRVKIIREYLLFYEITKTSLIVLSIWDGRRDDKSFHIVKSNILP